MIFVTVGSSSIPFDRLLRGIEHASIDEPLVVQHGLSTVLPGRAECVDFLDHEAFVTIVRSARVIITHAGVGSVMTALAECKRPIVVPRRKSYAEAVDDHQVPFARRAGELGLVTLVEDVNRLASAIDDHVSDRASPELRRSPVEVELRSYIEKCIGRRTQLAISERDRA
jgi:UDP-N-acetylglucosamine transferase subunit ALG13